MNYSNDILAKAEYFSRAGSCSLTGPQKKELGLIYFDLTGNKLNEGCPTCCRDAMRRFVSHLAESKNEVKKPIKKVPFKGVTQTKPKTTRKPRANASKKTTAPKA
jgi:hypothetical protein